MVPLVTPRKKLFFPGFFLIVLLQTPTHICMKFQTFQPCHDPKENHRNLVSILGVSIDK